MKNIYEKINFDEIVQKIEDKGYLPDIDNYHNDTDYEITDKKEAIERCFE